jgi:hypothetical protein
MRTRVSTFCCPPPDRDARISRRFVSLWLSFTYAEALAVASIKSYETRLAAQTEKLKQAYQAKELHGTLPCLFNASPKRKIIRFAP